MMEYLLNVSIAAVFFFLGAVYKSWKQKKINRVLLKTMFQTAEETDKIFEKVRELERQTKHDEEGNGSG